MGVKLRLNNVRVAFYGNTLYEAEAHKDNPTQNKKFKSSFLIEPGSDADTSIQDAIRKAAVEGWKDKAKAKLASHEGSKQEHCYNDASKYPEREVYQGFKVLSTSRREVDQAPKIFTPTGKKTDDRIIYSGCYVNVDVEFWAQSGTYEGMRCTPLALQFVKDGPSFSGATTAADDAFGALPGATEEEDEEGWDETSF